MTAQYDNLLSGGEYEVCVTAPRSQCVNDVNPSVLLPPGHPDGFGASEELIERASNLLICEYAMPQNCKPENVGFCLPPRKEGDSKQWITGRLKKFHQGFIASAIRKGDKCYGVGHAVFSNLLVIDVDNIKCDDKNIVRDGLRGLGWKFKVFDSGRGLHFWIFFSDLPYELLKRYGSGPNVMKQVGEAFLSMHADLLSDRIDLRGCGRSLIKLPLQYEPYHKKIVLPFDDDGYLIEDYEVAVEYAAMIQRNDSERLVGLLANNQKCETRRQYFPMAATAGEVGGSLEAYLDSVEVGEGESNDFIFELVKRLWRERIPEDQVVGIVEDLYERGKNEGRITCRDYKADWRSKARSQAKKYYGLMKDHSMCQHVSFFEEDLAWLRKHARSEKDLLFLSIHLFVRRLNGNKDYYLSRPFAMKFGISETPFKSASRKFQRCGLIKIVEKGIAGSESGKATRYIIAEEPESGTKEIEASTPGELVEMAMESSEEEKRNERSD